MFSFSSSKANAKGSSRRSGPLHPRQVAMLTRKASKILPGLWLSGLYTAVDEHQLAELGVTHVVSLIEQRPKYPRMQPKLKALHIPIQDVEGADILRHFDTMNAFIRAALEEDDRNVVLVHCAMGMSRSATAVCAYLVAERGMHPTDALAHVVARREIVCPNPGFRRQLDVFHKRLHDARKLYKAWRPAPRVIPPLRVIPRVIPQRQHYYLPSEAPAPPRVRARSHSHPHSHSLSYSHSHGYAPAPEHAQWAPRAPAPVAMTRRSSHS